jgi:hypothetical protein
MNRPLEPLRRRNHYVPASYLANFTREGTRIGRLWVYSRDEPMRPKHLSLNNVGLERDLYVRDDGQGPDDSMERYLADAVEGPFAAVLNRIVKGSRVGFIPGALNPADRSAIARFLTFQLLRTPVERDATRWLGELSTLGEVRENLQPTADLRRTLDAALGRPLTAQEEEAWLAFFTNLPQIRNRVADWIPRTRRNAERYAPLLEQLEWRVIRVPDSVELVTCDMPLVCARKGERPGSYTLGGAFGEADFEGTLALSPQHFLIVTRAIEDEHALRTEAFARSVRSRTIEYAHRWVYSPSNNEQIAQDLAASPAPSYYIECDGRVFHMGHPPQEIEREIRRSGVRTLQFRYGVPGRVSAPLRESKNKYLPGNQT